MQYIEEFGQSESEDEGLDTLLAAAALCLSEQKPEYYDEKAKRTAKRKKDDSFEEISLRDGSYTDAFETVADMPTVYKILDVCGGVKLNDPNLLAAAAEAVAAGQI